MQEQNDLDPGERELESSLSGLIPSAARIDPVAAAFNAGHRAGRRSVHLWQSAAILMLMIGAGSWLVPLNHRAAIPSQDHSQAVVALHDQPTPAEPPAAQSILVLQKAVRENGMDGLPPANLPDVQTVRAGDLF